MNKGFTLIELLIVIVIIGLLVSVAYSALNPIEARNKAIDTVRIRDISDLYNAVERYRSVKGDYPWTTKPVDGTSLDSSVLQNLIDTGDLKSEFKNRESLTHIYSYFDDKDNLYLCFIPLSTFYSNQTGNLFFEKIFAAESFKEGKVCFPK